MKPALADFSSAAKSATKAVETARSLLSKANNGQGALGLLLSDRETSEKRTPEREDLASHLGKGSIK